MKKREDRRKGEGEVKIKRETGETREKGEGLKDKRGRGRSGERRKGRRTEWDARRRVEGETGKRGVEKGNGGSREIGRDKAKGEQ